MIRKLPLLCVFLITLQLLNAQNFAPVGAKWHYQSWSPGSPTFGGPYTFVSFKVSKDTVIANKPAVILELPSVPESRIFFHEENDKLYFYEDNQFKLIFDYSLQPGDTLKFRIPQKFSYYGVDCSGGLDSIFYFAKVDSISSITIDNLSLKQYHTSRLNDSLNHWRLGTITERIFTINNFFGSGPAICLGGFAGHFRCYEDSDIYYKPVAEACNAATSVKELEKIAINVFPNPATDKISIIHSFKKDINVEIYSLDGSMILTVTLHPNQKEINLTDIPDGVYLLRIKEHGFLKKFYKI